MWDTTAYHRTKKVRELTAAMGIELLLLFPLGLDAKEETLLRLSKAQFGKHRVRAVTAALTQD